VSLSFAADALKLPADQNVVYVFQSPQRWDEFLDLRIPILISGGCESWDRLLEGLELSGLSPRDTVRLVETAGRVRHVIKDQHGWQPKPSEASWALALNWTHPEEGFRARQPLAGRHYIVTRQQQQGRDFCQKLQALGASVEAIPTIDFQPPDSLAAIQQALASLESWDWIIFTSPNGVKFFFEYLQKFSVDHRRLSNARLACVGPKTSKALQNQGFYRDLEATSYVAEGLIESLRAHLDKPPKTARILIPRAQEAREILPETLSQWGADVQVAAVYKTVAAPVSQESLSSITDHSRLLFSSASTVNNWVRGTSRTDLGCFCIGPATESAARKAGFKILGVAAVHTLDGLIETICELDKNPAEASDHG